MKTKYKILLTIFMVLLLTYFVGGASALSGLLYTLAYLSIFAVIMGLGAASSDGGVLLVCSLVFGGICFGGAFFLDDYADSEKEEKEYLELMHKSYSTSFDAKDNTLHKMQSLAESTRDKKQSYELKSRVKNVCDSLYKIAENIGTINGWRKYQEVAPADYHKDSYEKISKLEALEWNTDSKAWQQASSANTISSYDKYLSLYPLGKYAKDAEKRIVDIGIAKTYSGEHGSLPQMDRVRSGNGPKSLIRVNNNTGYTLTLLYSGTDSKRLVISPQGSETISLYNGAYKVAAFVSASNVRSYAGSEKLLGGEYSVSYYISSY